MGDYVVRLKTREGEKTVKINDVRNETVAMGEAVERLQELQPLRVIEVRAQAEYNHQQ